MPDETQPASTETGMDRRRFLQRAAATGAVISVPGWLAAACSSSSKSVGNESGVTSSSGAGATPSAPAKMVSIKATHGTGLCNLGIFLTKERDLAKADGVDLQFVVTPTNADIATLFGAGQVQASLIPYTNFMTLFDKGAPVSIVAGGGTWGV